MVRLGSTGLRGLVTGKNARRQILIRGRPLELPYLLLSFVNISLNLISYSGNTTGVSGVCKQDGVRDLFFFFSLFPVLERPPPVRYDAHVRAYLTFIRDWSKAIDGTADK